MKSYIRQLAALGLLAASASITLTTVNTRSMSLSREVGLPLPTTLLSIPAGTFLMGDAFGEGYPDEQPVHGIALDPYYIDSCEVSKFLGDDIAIWAATHGYDIGPATVTAKDQHHPVVKVTWYEAVKWANARSEKEALTPCYYTDETQSTVYRTGLIDLTNECVKWNADGYRLPTEAEWEHAARGGCASFRFPWCDSDTIDHSRANYFSTGEENFDAADTRGYHPAFSAGGHPNTSPVGSFPPNSFGLYDMAGNVWEWCWDWFGPDSYTSAPVPNPRGPAAGAARVARGGSWASTAFGCRVSCRNFYPPESSYSNLGFRLVRAVASAP